MSFPKMRLDKVCRITMGQAPSGDSYNFDGNGLALIAGAGDFGKETPEPKKFTTAAGKKSEKEEIILCIRATIGDLNWSDQEYCLGRGVAGLFGHKDKLDQKYLWHWLKNIASFLKSKGKGATFLQVTKEDICSLEIPLPPLPEQRRIASILDKADELRQKRQQAIEKLDQLLQATFIDMFGDPVSNPKGWDKEKMDTLMTIVRGGSPRPIENFLGGTYPWIKIGDATKGDDLFITKTKEAITGEGLHKTRLLPEGSVIFANCGVSLGFARILKIQGCIHDGWLAFQDISEDKIHKLFLLKALNSITQYFRDTAPDGTQPNLNTAIMKNFELIIPPMDLQLKFIAIVESIEKQKKLFETSSAELSNLFNALQNQAFNGTL